MSYIVPQVLVYQEFNLVPGAITQPLRACLVGPVFSPLIRYSVPGERMHGYLAEYDPNLVPPNDPSGFKEFLWPNRGGSVVDHSFTKLTIENALLRYFSDTEVVHATFHDKAGKRDGYKNRIRSESMIFAGTGRAIYGNDTSPIVDTTYFDLPAGPGGTPRDVRPGDVVQLRANVDSQLITYESYVTGLVPDRVPSSYALPDAPGFSKDPNNAATQADVFKSFTVIPSDNEEANSSSVVIANLAAIDAASYDGIRDGNVVETYTIEVITSGITGTAGLRVYSASGNDDVLSVVGTLTTPVAIGTRGLTVTFTGPEGSRFIAGQRWEITVKQIFNAVDITTAEGTYTGNSDTTYVVEVVRGGNTEAADSADRPQINVYTTTGSDVSGPLTLSDQDDVTVGNFGIRINFDQPELCKGDRFYVNAMAERDGEIRTLVLAHRLPDELLGEPQPVAVGSSPGPWTVPDMDLTLLVRRTVEIDRKRISSPGVFNWQGTELEIGIKDNIEAYVDDVRSNTTGARLALPVMSGSMYVTYRAFSQLNLRTIQSIHDVSEINDRVGVLHPDQPMAAALEKAMANCSGTPVKFLPVADSSKEAYAEALEILTGTDEVYSLVPLTFDREIQNMFAAHVEGMSSPENGRWRITIVSTPARTDMPLVTTDAVGGTILATVIDDPASETVENTLVEIVTPEGQDPLDLQALGVMSNDIVRAVYQGDGFGDMTYKEYRVDSVISNDTLRLQSPGMSVAVNTPSKIEIWRRLNTTQVAEDVGSRAGSFYSRRVYNVWPDYIGSAGVEHPGYILAAAVAGQVSGVVPHQGHTNLELLGFDSVTRTTELFNRSQLNRLASSGVYIVTQDPLGKVYTRHELSTNNRDVNMRELMVTKNVDAMSYVYLKTLEPFIGISNITPTLLDQIGTEILSTTDYLKTNGFVARLGSQLIDGKLTRLERHPTLKDRLVAVLEIEIPYPLNNLELHLVVPA